MPMKIDRVEVFGVAMALVGTFTSGGVTKSTTKCLVVRLHASDGAIGVRSIDPSTTANRLRKATHDETVIYPSGLVGLDDGLPACQHYAESITCDMPASTPLPPQSARRGTCSRRSGSDANPRGGPRAANAWPVPAPIHLTHCG